MKKILALLCLAIPMAAISLGQSRLARPNERAPKGATIFYFDPTKNPDGGVSGFTLCPSVDFECAEPGAGEIDYTRCAVNVKIAGAVLADAGMIPQFGALSLTTSNCLSDARSPIRITFDPPVGGARVVQTSSAGFEDEPPYMCCWRNPAWVGDQSLGLCIGQGIDNPGTSQPHGVLLGTGVGYSFDAIVACELYHGDFDDLGFWNN